MTTPTEYDRCPRCQSEDTSVLTLENWPSGTKAVLRCDGCAVTFQTWHPAPTAGAR